MNYSVDSLGVQMYRKVQNGSTSSPLQVVIGAAAGHNALTADSLPRLIHLFRGVEKKTLNDIFSMRRWKVGEGKGGVAFAGLMRS